MRNRSLGDDSSWDPASKLNHGPDVASCSIGSFVVCVMGGCGNDPSVQAGAKGAAVGTFETFWNCNSGSRLFSAASLLGVSGNRERLLLRRSFCSLGALLFP